MEDEYIVRAEEMTALADAIRNKGGTTEPLTWFSGFVDAVQNIGAHAQRAYVDGLFDDINDFTWECTAVIVTE